MKSLLTRLLFLSLFLPLGMKVFHLFSMPPLVLFSLAGIAAALILIAIIVRLREPNKYLTQSMEEI